MSPISFLLCLRRVGRMSCRRFPAHPLRIRRCGTQVGCATSGRSDSHPSALESFVADPLLRLLDEIDDEGGECLVGDGFRDYHAGGVFRLSGELSRHFQLQREVAGVDEVGFLNWKFEYVKIFI